MTGVEGSRVQRRHERPKNGPSSNTRTWQRTQQRTQEEPGGPIVECWEPEGARRSQEPRGSQEEPGARAKSQQEPDEPRGAQRSQQEPEASRSQRSQEEPEASGLACPGKSGKKKLLKKQKDD